jgi:2-iminobutanoate/2-iminopropanoate deaminase
MSGIVRSNNPVGLSAKRAHIFAQTVRVEHPKAIVFVSGQVARDAEANSVGIGDIAAQTEQVMKNLQVALRAEGAELCDLVKVTVYTTDLRYAPEIDKVRLRFFVERDKLPASTLLEVSKLAHPDYLVEIDGIAVIR